MFIKKINNCELKWTTLRELGHEVESEAGVCKNGENAWVSVGCRLQRNLDPKTSLSTSVTLATSLH